MLDNEDEDEDVDEEPGEIIDDIDERVKSFKPFNYKTINEEEILSTSK